MALQCLSHVLSTTTLSSSHLSSKASVFNRTIVLRNNPNSTSLLLNQNALLTFRKHTTRKNAYINSKHPTNETGERSHTEKSLTRKDFPPEFIFGAGSSAIQIEGGDGTEGGRGRSSWDDILTYENGVPKGANSFNMYKDDVKILKDMGVDYYRFSISWPRILPDGDKKNVNKEGIAYYHALLDELEANNIKPLVTLFHFDMPAALDKKYGGFSDRRIINDFKDYCETCFEHFGGRVKRWTTINESMLFIVQGPNDNVLGPTSDTPTTQIVKNHNFLLAHAAVVDLYRKHHQGKKGGGGEIGMTALTKWCEPLDPKSPADQACVPALFDRTVGWQVGPLFQGDYSPELKKFIKNLPTFTEEEKKLMKGSCDFLGLNYYTSNYGTPGYENSFSVIHATKTEFVAETPKRDGVAIGPVTMGAYPTYVYPEGLRKMLMYVKDYYGNPKVYITENGVPGKPTISLSVKEAIAAGKSEMVDVELVDDYRIDAIYGHIEAVHTARKDGANVQGYFVWSLIDNNEFGDYPVRYGLTYIDWFDNCKRYPKKSAKWYGRFLQPNKPVPINPIS